jgi:hypothetical protein
MAHLAAGDEGLQSVGLEVHIHPQRDHYYLQTSESSHNFY